MVPPPLPFSSDTHPDVDPDEDPLFLAPYNPAWPRLFTHEAARLEIILHPWTPTIRHIGSTAVPHLAAKNIIDIMVGLAPFIISPELIAQMESLGNEYEFTRDNWALFNRRPPDQPGFNVHFHLTESDRWRQHLQLIKALRNDSSLRAEYQSLKEHLCATCLSIVDYSDQKGDFIQNVFQRLNPDLG